MQTEKKLIILTVKKNGGGEGNQRMYVTFIRLFNNILTLGIPRNLWVCKENEKTNFHRKHNRGIILGILILKKNQMFRALRKNTY